MGIEKYTVEELQQEIKKREEEKAKKELQESRPQLLLNPDIQKIVDHAEAYINYLMGADYHEDTDSDWRYYFYEEVMTALYGKDVWKWISKRTA